MKTKTRYLAALLALAGIDAAIIIAPVAVAYQDTAANPAATSKVPAADPSTSPGSASTRGETGGDPLVPDGTVVNPYIYGFDGGSLPY